MDRTLRISEQVKRELGDIISNEIKDPRLPQFTSITSVHVTRDLRYATVHVSVLGGEEERENALLALKSAAKYIRREVGQRIKLRYTPEFIFEIDRSIEKGIYMSSLIDKTIKEDERIDKEKEQEE